MLELSCRVRPLSESLNDLFREVSLLRKRITELSHRLEALEPFLRHYGYRGIKEGAAAAGGHGGEEVVAAGDQSSAPGGKGSRVVGRRRVRVLRNGGVKLLQRVRDTQWVPGWESLEWWNVSPSTHCRGYFIFVWLRVWDNHTSNVLSVNTETQFLKVLQYIIHFNNLLQTAIPLAVMI